MKEVELGDYARDRITGFNGTVTAVCYYLDGNIGMLLERLIDQESYEENWFPKNRLEVVKKLKESSS